MGKKKRPDVPWVENTFEEYTALDGVRPSSMLSLKTSPRAFRWRETHPGIPATKAMRVGTMVHHLAFGEPESDITIFTDYRKKADRDARDEIERHGLPHGTKADLALAKTVVNALNESEPAANILGAVRDQGAFEATLQWSSPATGLPYKSRLDGIWLEDAPGHATIFELKTTSKPVGTFAESIGNFGYYFHAGMREAGLNASGYTMSAYVMVAVETEPPHDVSFGVLDPKSIELGRKLFDVLDRRLLLCREKDSYPGIGQDVERWIVPNYVRQRVERDIEWISAELGERDTEWILTEPGENGDG